MTNEQAQSQIRFALDQTAQAVSKLADATNPQLSDAIAVILLQRAREYVATASSAIADAIGVLR